MGKNIFQKIIVFIIFLLFICIIFQPITSLKTFDFPPEIEGDHFPCGVEYWWLYTMLTFEDGRQWDMCAQFFYVMNWTDNDWSETEGVSYLRIQSWNRETGNYYDYFKVNDREFGIILGDVSGKGTSAALYQSKIQGFVRALIATVQSPKELLCKVNRLTFDNIEEKSFATLVSAFINPQNNHVILARAGHTPVLFYQH